MATVNQTLGGDKFSEMTMKQAMQQLTNLGCSHVKQVAKYSRSVTFWYHDKQVLGDARDLLREISQDVAKQLATIEWF